jgi:hypothetical protein
METENATVGERSRSITVDVEVPPEVVERARERQAAADDPSVLEDYIVDEFRWSFEADRAPSGK